MPIYRVQYQGREVRNGQVQNISGMRTVEADSFYLITSGRTNSGFVVFSEMDPGGGQSEVAALRLNNVVYIESDETPIEVSDWNEEPNHPDQPRMQGQTSHPQATNSIQMQEPRNSV